MLPLDPNMKIMFKWFICTTVGYRDGRMHCWASKNAVTMLIVSFSLTVQRVSVSSSLKEICMMVCILFIQASMSAAGPPLCLSAFIIRRSVGRRTPGPVSAALALCPLVGCMPAVFPASGRSPCDHYGPRQLFSPRFQSPHRVFVGNTGSANGSQAKAKVISSQSSTMATLWCCNGR